MDNRGYIPPSTSNALHASSRTTAAAAVAAQHGTGKTTSTAGDGGSVGSGTSDASAGSNRYATRRELYDQDHEQTTVATASASEGMLMSPGQGRNDIETGITGSEFSLYHRHTAFSPSAREAMSPGHASRSPPSKMSESRFNHYQQHDQQYGGQQPSRDDPVSPRRLNYVSDPPGKPANVSSSVTLQHQSTRQALQRQTEIQDADRDLTSWRERKLVNREQREKEQRQDLKMLREYQPWGRPGAGAPNKHTDGNSLTQMPSSEIAARDQDLKTADRDPVPEMSLSLGSRRGGGGEASRTGSGRLRTRLPAHPETRFQESNFLPSACRASRQDSEELDELEQKARRRTKRLETVDEKNEAIFYPYGQPGCGAPLKTSSGTLKTTLPTSELDSAQREHLEQRRREAQRYREQLEEQAGEKRSRSSTHADDAARTQYSSYDPWGKGTGNMPRDSAGFIRLPPKHRDPIDTALATDKVSTVADALRRQNSDPLAASHGHGGAVAGSDANVSGLANADNLLANQERYIYLQSLRDAAEVKRSDRLKEKRPSGSDSSTADWMQSLNGGRPKRDPLTDKVVAGDRKGLKDLFACGSEDAISPRRRGTEDKQELHAQLSEQAELRQRAKRDDRAREKEEVEKHMDALDGMFGRPGCGAPLRDDRGRVQAGRLNSNELTVEGYKADTTAVRL